MQITVNRKSVFFIGIFIFLIPFMGIPTFWKTLFITLSGLFLIISGVDFSVSIPKKPVKPRVKKEKTTTKSSTSKEGEVDDFVLENLTNTRSREEIIE